jgi:hypothetical protein
MCLAHSNIIAVAVDEVRKFSPAVPEQMVNARVFATVR